MPPRRRRGPVERKVRADIGALITAHPMGEALSEMSFSLARMMDCIWGGAEIVDAKLAATVNKELRVNLLELSRLAVDDSDDLDDELSTPVRDGEES